MFVRYCDMWEGKLGRTDVTQTRINSRPSARSAHLMPYTQGTEMRDMTSKQIGEKLREGVIEPETANGLRTNTQSGYVRTKSERKYDSSRAPSPFIHVKLKIEMFS